MVANTEEVGVLPQAGDAVKSSDTNLTYAWYAVAVFNIALISSFIDRQILSLLVGPIKADLQISDTEMSLLMGFAFALFYVFVAIPIARLADIKSRRLIIGVGIALWSLMTVMCGIAKNYWQLFIARVGIGVGESSRSALPSVLPSTLPFMPGLDLASRELPLLSPLAALPFGSASGAVADSG